MRKISCDLDGSYWNSNNHRNSHRGVNENRSAFYENGFRLNPTTPTWQRKPEHEPQFPQLPQQQPQTQNYHQQPPFVIGSLSLERELVEQIKFLTEQTQRLAQNQQSFNDSWQRYLQHFEENLAELRQMIQFQQFQFRNQDMQTPQESVAVTTCFDQPKQEPENDREVAQTLISLGERQSFCTSLHGFQTCDSQNYYWIAHSVASQDAVPIHESESQTIEDAYQKLVRYGAQNHSIPHSCSVGNIYINFDSREGSINNARVRFCRLKK